MDALAVRKNQLNAATVAVGVKADASGKLPTKLALVPSGVWLESWKGNLEITVGDLLEMKANFEKGIGLPARGREGMPVDYSHEDGRKAAFWIKAVDVENGILYATQIEWTPAGAQAVIDGEFKFFSPSFYPACLGQWYDPENPLNMARNVIVGGGLTNIPFFSDMDGLKASRTASGGSGDSMIYISADLKGETMDLATARAMKPTEVTEEAKKVLTDNKGELTAAEQVAFGLADAPAPAPADTPPAGDTTPQPTDDQQQAAQVQADIKSGKMVLVEASKYKSLEDRVDAATTQLEANRKEKIEAAVDEHVKRGAIVADQKDKWVSRIMADGTIEDDLKSLPSNQLLADKAFGQSGGDANAVEQDLHKQTTAKIQAAREKGNTLKYSEARKQVMDEQENK